MVIPSILMMTYYDHSPRSSRYNLAMKQLVKMRIQSKVDEFILNYLESHEKASSKELTDNSEYTRGTIIRNLKELMKQNKVDSKRFIEGGDARYVYYYLIRGELEYG